MDIENWTEKDMQAFGEAVQEAIKLRDYYIARFPDFHSVKDKIDSLPTIDDKINFLKEVISTWEVNCSIADFQGDTTAEKTKNRYLSLYNKILDHLKLQKELQENSQQENSSNEYKFKEDFLNELFKKCEYHFKCSYREFVEAMSKANFHDIFYNVSRVRWRCKAFIATIGKINEVWYQDAIISIGFEKKRDVSKALGHRDVWLDEIIEICKKYYKI